METLEGTSWDVLISGTGIQQSLLALALSRCGKKVLHIDQNDAYGGSEAALSLQEAEQWVEKVNSATWRSPFSHAAITCAENDEVASKLGSSRNYSLSLAPTLLYTRSALLPVLVSSRAHQQLEFQAVGSWFVYGQEISKEPGSDESAVDGKSKLIRVPNGREDIFADRSLTLKAKGSLMRFLRFVASYEEKPEVWESNKDMPFPEFLTQQFNLPVESHGPLLALSLSPTAAEATAVGFAIPRIARHLRSIGMFGPGFGSVIPKWGGLSEVAQVACRAGAVGGAVYVLGKGIESIEITEDDDIEEIPRPELDQGHISQEVSDAIGARNFLPTDEESLDTLEKEIKDQSLEELLAAAGFSVDIDEDKEPAEPTPAKEEVPVRSSEEQRKFGVHLQDGVTVKTDFVVGTKGDLPEAYSGKSVSSSPSTSATATRSISIVSAALPTLYPPTAEGGVTPAGAVIVFPSGSLGSESHQTPPVHIIAHTGDTGECPQGQTVLYASIATVGDEASSLLKKAVNSLLATQKSDVEVLWSLQYQQDAESSSSSTSAADDANVIRFPDTPLDLAFEDTILDNVKEAWKVITGSDDDEFMKFEDRGAAAEENSDDDE